MSNIGEWLRWSTQRLKATSEQPALEAQLLLAESLQKPRAWLLAHPEQTLEVQQENEAEARVLRLLAGEPLPYVLGHWEFYGLDFALSPAVLIPRPETELLVETALDWLRRHPTARWVADVGTGSGCIAATLAHHIPDLQVMALELDSEAMKVAQVNFKRQGLDERVQLVQSDLLNALPEPVDVLCANLPYIPTSDLQELPISRTEPNLALDGGSDGLRVIERLLQQMAEKQACRGLALLEIERRQADQVKAMARHYFPQGKIIVQQDLAGHDRLVSIEMKG